MANQQPVIEKCDGMLFEALRIARVPDRLAFAADKEVREMAATNVSAKIDARLDAFEKRLDSFVRNLKWTVGILISVTAVVVSIFGFRFLS